MDHQQQELVAATDMEMKTSIEPNEFHFAARGNLSCYIHVNNNLSPEQSGQIYEVEPNYLLTNDYPNLYIIPMIHNVDLHKTEN